MITLTHETYMDIRTLFRITTCIILFVNAKSIANPWYGTLSFNNTQGDLPKNGSLGPSPFTALKTDERSNGFKLSAGYEFTPILSLEFGYTDLGKQTIVVNNNFSSLTNTAFNTIDSYYSQIANGTFNPFSATVDFQNLISNTNATNTLSNTESPTYASDSSDILAGAINGSKSTINNYGIHLIGKGIFPMRNQLSFILKGGLLRTETKTETTSIVFQWVTIGSGLSTTEPFIFIPIKKTEKYHHLDPIVGLGISFDLTKTLSAEISTEKYFGVAYGDGLDADMLSYDFSIRYRF